MSQSSVLRRAPGRPRAGELWRKLLVSAFFAFPLLFAKVAPVAAAGQQEGQMPAGEDPTGEEAGQPAAPTTPGPGQGEISLPDALGGAKVDADTLTTLQSTIDRMSEGRTPQNMVAIYNGARDTINALGPQGPLSALGMENVGAEITFSLDAKGQIATGIGPDSNPDTGAATTGVKARVVSEVGTNLADGKNQIAVGVLGITSRSLTTGEVGIPDQVTQGRRTNRSPVDLAGPGAAAEEHAGVVYAYVTPTDQPIPSAFPDITKPETMTIGSTLRMMPVDANWSTWSTSMPGYYDDTVDVHFGDMFQITRVSENTYEIATGPVDIDVSEPGIQISLAGTRLAVAASDVKGVAHPQARNYDLSKPDEAAAFQGVLAEGVPQTGWNPNQVDVEFGQFAINGYLTPAAPSAKTPNKTPGVEDPGPFSLNIAADLTLKGQIPYSGYVVAEIQPPATADEQPTVVFSRYAPGVEITGKGVLFTDAQGNQYVRDTTVQMRIPELDFMPHKGIIDITQAQLAILNQVNDFNVEPPDLTLHEIFPGVLPDFLSPASNFALIRGIEALYDLGVTSDRFLVPGNVDYRTQPPAIEDLAPPGVTVDFDTRVDTGEDRGPGPRPDVDGPRSEAPAADAPVSDTPALVDAAPDSMAAAAIRPDADFSEAFGPDTAIAKGPLEQAIEEAAAEAAASVDFDPVPVIEPGFGFDGLGLRSDAESSEPTGLDATDETEAAPGARESEISAAAAELGLVVDFDAASFDLGLDGADISDFSAASEAAAGIGADADFSGGFTDAESSEGSGSEEGSAPSEADISAAAGEIGASADFGADASSFESGLDGFSTVGESSAASQAAAGIGADADFSGAFGDSAPASSTPTDGGSGTTTRGLTPGGTGTETDGSGGFGTGSGGTDDSGGSGTSDDSSSLDSSGFGTDTSSDISGFSAASEAAASIGSDADFSGAFTSSSSTDSSDSSGFSTDSSGFSTDSSGFSTDSSGFSTDSSSFGGDSSSFSSFSSTTSSSSDGSSSSTSSTSSSSSSGGFSTSGDSGF